ncbi:MAG: hypothetical protein AAF945_11335 [Actinomycetota bacterium]
MSESFRALPPPSGPIVSPAATEEEAVAIMAAVEALWPRPVVAAEPPDRRSGNWKFSGRWWSRPVTVRRDRPWR